MAKKHSVRLDGPFYRLPDSSLTRRLVITAHEGPDASAAFSVGGYWTNGYLTLNMPITRIRHDFELLRKLEAVLEVVGSSESKAKRLRKRMKKQAHKPLCVNSLFWTVHRIAGNRYRPQARKVDRILTELRQVA